MLLMIKRNSLSYMTEREKSCGNTDNLILKNKQEYSSKNWRMLVYYPHRPI